jgi:Xaa-Pro aminopeptidase
MQRSNDVATTFEQEANFWWLTGIEAPNWLVIIDGTRRKSWLIAPEMSKVQTLFDGGLDFEEAKKTSGVDDVLTRDSANSMLRDSFSLLEICCMLNITILCSIRRLKNSTTS